MAESEFKLGSCVSGVTSHCKVHIEILRKTKYSVFCLKTACVVITSALMGLVQSQQECTIVMLRKEYI